jgi:chromosome partitioning protein
VKSLPATANFNRFVVEEELAMTHVFVFTNHKGGVGKSTSATNIAFGMVGVLRKAQASNCRVLLIDTDTQAHATLITTSKWDYGRENSLYAVLMADRPNAASVLTQCIVPSEWDPDLHILPASATLEAAESELKGVPGAPYRLADPLSKISSEYAAIIIDTHPSFSLLTEMALLAATDAIVPAEPRYLETVGLTSVIGKISEIREAWRHPELRISGILVTKMDTRIRGHNELLNDLKAHNVLSKLLLGVIPANEAVSYAHHQHQSVFVYSPKSAASRAYAQVVGSLVRYLAKGNR